MENNDFNKRILNRLEEKIAIEEFRKQSNIPKKKSHKFFKVASFILVLGIASANLYTYATFKQDIVNYVLNKIGIFDESIVQIEETQESNNISLTLENYAIENDNLIIGYKLKASKDADLGVEYIIDDTNLIKNEKTYHIEKSTSIFLTPISDTEYELIKIYNIGNIKINEGDILETKLFLPKYLDSGEHIGEWEFKIKLELKNVTLTSEKYNVENVRGTLDWIGETFNMNHTFKVLELENTSLYTKLTILLESYWTGGQKYTVEITDENENILLQDGVQNLFGGVPTEIILKKIDMNSKINIIVRECCNEEITAKGSTILDLSKDLKPKEEKEIEYTTTTWKNLKFKYDKEMSVDRRNNRGYCGYYEVIDFGLYTLVGDERYDIGDGSIQIECQKNEFNYTLSECFEEYKAINVESYSSGLFENTKINGIDAITWNEYADKMYMFVYKDLIYTIRASNEIKAIPRVDEFINNITFL